MDFSRVDGIEVPKLEDHEDLAKQTGESEMKLTAVDIDIAALVFQVHHVDERTGEIASKPLERGKSLEYFVNRAPCLIGMEAGGGAPHWARALTKQGHEVKLMPAQFVKAFDIRNKSDAADARAIWLAVQQPSKAVEVKTETRPPQRVDAYEGTWPVG